MSSRTTYRLINSVGIRAATAVGLKDGKVLAVPQKEFYDSVDEWKSAIEKELSAELTLRTESVAAGYHNRPLTQIPGYNKAAKLKKHFSGLHDDVRLVLSLAHKYGLKDGITPRGFFRPTRLYVQMETSEGMVIAPIHFNRMGRLRVTFKDVEELPRYEGKLNIFLDQDGVYKLLNRFPSHTLPPAGVPVVIIENKSHYFLAQHKDQIQKFVDAGYFVEVVLSRPEGRALRPNLGTDKRLAELYRRAEHKFEASYYSSGLVSAYNSQTVDQYLAARWALKEVEGADWFKSDIICSNLKDSIYSWKLQGRWTELAEAAVWLE
jgi:hypothetical protein